MSPQQPAAQATNKQAILAIILVSYVMIVLDISVVLTGLPRIQRDLGFSGPDLAWVQSAYTLTFGGFLLLGARAGDILGRRRMFVAGLALFTLASFAIGVSSAAPWMLAWRAIQGIGAAILAPSTLALLQTNFAEGPERTRAISLYSAAAGVSATAGLVLGGILADWLSWRVGFFLNIPIGVATIAAAYRYIAETPRRGHGFDVPGALLSTTGTGALVYGFIRSAEAGWHDPVALATLAASAVSIVLFVAQERRAAQPILPLRLFASRERSGAYAARVLFLGASVGFFFFTTLHLQDIMGYSPALTGIAFVPATILNFPAAMATPRLIRRFGAPLVLVCGLVIGLIGMAWLSRASAGSGYVVSVALPMLLALATKEPVSALYVLIAYLIVQFIDNNFFVPKIVASKVKINALISIIVVLVGNALWGVPGMFLSIPLTAVVKVIFDRIPPLEPFGFLLGDNLPDFTNQFFTIRKKRTRTVAQQNKKPSMSQKRSDSSTSK